MTDDPRLERRRNRTLVKNFENATRIHEMRGTHHPDEWYEIDMNFAKAKAALLQRLNTPFAEETK